MVMKLVRAKYQEIHVPTGDEACGVKEVTGINNYSSR